MTHLEHTSLRRFVSGKVHWMVVGGFLAIITVIVILSAGSENPQLKARMFMNALAQGDAKTLAKTSYSANKNPEELLAAWKQTTEDAKYYRFKYEILGAATASPSSAAVRLWVWRNYSPESYEESFQLKMKKVEGAWKVEIEGLSRQMYPFLPR